MDVPSPLLELLAQAELPSAVEVSELTGRGFDNEIFVATLRGGRRVVLRRWRTPRPAEHARAQFLAAHRVPAPALLAADAHGSLVEFAPGAVLGDLIDSGRDSSQVWRLVGEAYRRVHDVGFPAGITGQLRPDDMQLTYHDVVTDLHADIDGSVDELRRILPLRVADLPALHDVVETAAEALRAAPSALGHGDIHMWNVLVSPTEATLIDWDYPEVRDPAMELALLDKHASLFNGTGLPAAFFDGYGRAPTEPNTSVQRVVQTLQWATSDDWANFETNPRLSAELKQRARSWHAVLVDYVHELPEHIRRLRDLVRR